MKMKFSIFFLSANINAVISQNGITDLRKLDTNQINTVIKGNHLSGLVSDDF